MSRRRRQGPASAPTWPGRGFDPPVPADLPVQACVFKVDYVVEQISREFGSVFIGQENVALSVVQAGWAKWR